MVHWLYADTKEALCGAPVLGITLRDVECECVVCIELAGGQIR